MVYEMMAIIDNLSDLSDTMSRVNLNSNHNQINELPSKPNFNMNWFSPNYYPSLLTAMAQQLRQQTEELDINWEGLQTTDDKRLSAQFQCVLLEMRAIICPNCRTGRMDARNGYLLCECGQHFQTMLSIHQIIQRMLSTLQNHTNVCGELFPRFGVFKTNLVICCHKCSFSQHIL